MFGWNGYHNWELSVYKGMWGYCPVSCFVHLIQCPCMLATRSSCVCY